jgi:hypothetical protein
MKAKPKPTCARCERPVGLIGANRARPYTHYIDGKGVSIVCTKDKGSCKRAQAARKAKEKKCPGTE